MKLFGSRDTSCCWRSRLRTGDLAHIHENYHGAYSRSVYVSPIYYTISVVYWLRLNVLFLDSIRSISGEKIWYFALWFSGWQHGPYIPRLIFSPCYSVNCIRFLVQAFGVWYFRFGIRHLDVSHFWLKGLVFGIWNICMWFSHPELTFLEIGLWNRMGLAFVNRKEYINRWPLFV